MRKFSWLLILIAGFAQAEGVMEETMYSEGKIYVVIGVLVIIFITLILYLMRLDKKLTRLEKEYKQ